MKPEHTFGVRICHPFGNPFSFNAAISFLESGKLIRFHTSLYQPFGLEKRFHRGLPKARVVTHPFPEVIRLALTNAKSPITNGRLPKFVDWVARNFDQQTARALKNDDTAVYCYEDSAENTFRHAQQLGIKCIYELPIMHYREMQQIFAAETGREPTLKPFFETFREPKTKLERKDYELLTADVIVVPTTLVRESIKRYLNPTAKFIVAPYGSDTTEIPKVWNEADQHGPIRLFFAGILGPRKGLHILFEALSTFPEHHFHVTLGGRWEPGFQEWIGKRYKVKYECLGQIPHRAIYGICRRSHLLAFPSLAEGFGLVILEAMASGIPVLASTHTAAPDVVTEGVDGWIVPAGDISALRQTLQLVLDTRNRLPEMGTSARRKAEMLSWECYRSHLSRSVSQLLAA